MLAYAGREAMVMAPPHTCDSAASPCFHGCLAFLCRHFPPWSPPSHPLDCISTVNSSPSPGIAPQFLNSSSQPLHLLGTCSPVWGMYGCGKDCLILIHLGSHRSAVSLSALKVSPLTHNCPNVGIRLLLQFPHPQRQVQFYWHSCFPP